MTTETEVKTLPNTLVHAMMARIGKGMFSVVFLKKDGSERKMSGRRGVKKHLKGGESTIKDHPNLYGMYENGNHYRCFDCNRVLELRGAGVILKVKN